MSTRVAIHDLGPIARALLKGIADEPALEHVAVSDLADIENIAYLLRFDTMYRRYRKPVAVEDGKLVVGGLKLEFLRSCDPSALPWKEVGIKLVSECTGVPTRREDLEKHVRAGARFALLPAPSEDDEIETFVHGTNLQLAQEMMPQADSGDEPDHASVGQRPHLMSFPLAGRRNPIRHYDVAILGSACSIARRDPAESMR